MLKSVCIHISDRCNLSCKNCWTNSSPDGTNFITYQNIIDLINALQHLGLTRVSLSGGEPFMHVDLLNIIEYLISRDIFVDITTNGTLLNTIKRIIKRLDNNCYKQIKIRISIDGPKRQSEQYRGDGTFDKSISAINLVKRNLGKVFVNTVVPSLIDINEWILYFRQMKQIGVDKISLISLSPRGRGKINFTDFFDVHKNMLYLEDAAIKNGMDDFILKWDYLTVSHGYVLIESDRRIILPGIFNDEDITIGTLENIDPINLINCIEKYRKILNYNMKI